MSLKFYIDIDAETREITPLNERLALKYEREDNQIFFRHKLQSNIEIGDYQLGSGKVDDFTWLSGYKDSPCSQFIIRIEKFGNEIYRGVFSLYEVNFDFIEYRASLKPTTYDRYFDILKNQEDEKNIVNVEYSPDISYFNEKYIKEEADYTWTNASQIFVDQAFIPYMSCDGSSFMISASDWTQLSGVPDELKNYYEKRWYLDRLAIKLVSTNNYTIVFRWRRYSKWFQREDDQPIDDFDNWKNVGELIEVNNTMFDRMVHYVSDMDEGMKYDEDTGYPDDYCYFEDKNEYNIEAEEINIKMVRNFQKVIEYMYGGTISVSYFDDTAEYKYLRIANKSDIKKKIKTGNDPTEWARDWFMTWLNLTDILRKMFRMYWYIDNSGVCVFLPMKSPYVEFVDCIDLVSDEYRNAKTGNTVIANNIKNLPSISDFNFMEQGAPDFMGKSILYPACVNIKNEEDNGVPNITTDLMYIFNVDDIEEIAKEGYVLFSIRISGGLPFVRLDEAKLTKNKYMNGALSWASLQDQNYKNDMPYANAEINGELQAVNNDLTYRRPYLRKQVKIHLCEGDLPDFYSEPNKIKTIETEHGTGIIDAFEYDFIDNQAIIDIAFKDLSNA